MLLCGKIERSLTCFVVPYVTSPAHAAHLADLVCALQRRLHTAEQRPKQTSELGHSQEHCWLMLFKDVTETTRRRDRHARGTFSHDYHLLLRVI